MAGAFAESPFFLRLVLVEVLVTVVAGCGKDERPEKRQNTAASAWAITRASRLPGMHGRAIILLIASRLSLGQTALRPKAG